MLTGSGSGGAPLGRATFQNIASRLRETPTFAKTGVSPGQNLYFCSGRPSLSTAQAQRAKKKLQNASVFYFFGPPKLRKLRRGPMARMGSQGMEKVTVFNVFSICCSNKSENSMFFHTFGACVQSPPSLTKRKGADGYRLWFRWRRALKIFWSRPSHSRGGGCMALGPCGGPWVWLCASVALWLCAPWPRNCPHVVRSGRSGLILICRIPCDLVLRASNLKGAAFRTRNHF